MWTHSEMTEEVLNRIINEVIRPESPMSVPMRQRIRIIIWEALQDAHDIGVDHATEYVKGW